MHAPTPITAGTVGIFAPSSPFPEERYEAGLRRLRELGLTPLEHPDLRATKGYLAGDDDTRLTAIHDLLDDDRVDLLWAARGGYGLHRIADRLDAQRMRRAAKPIVGFSDVCALHAVAQAKAELITVHGPVVARDEGAGIVLSERRAHWEREMDAWDTLLRFVQTETVAEAITVAAELPLSFNFVLADQDGHIGYRQTGRQPIRAPGYDRRLPLPGQGQAEWQGYLSPAEMPHVLDPQDGVLGNWNNKPVPGWVNGDPVNWGVVDRVDRVLELLPGADSITPVQVKAIAHDIGRHDYRSDVLLPYLLEALAAPGISTDPRLGDAEQVLRDWDHRAEDGSVGESLFDAWRVRVFRDVFADELGSFLTPLEDPYNPTGDSLLLRSLQGPAAGLPVARDYFDGVDPEAMLVRGLITALDDLTTQFGTTEMDQWGWDPGIIEFTFGPFTFGEVPWHSRGSYMQFVEMTRPRVLGENVLPLGNSGTLLLDGAGLLKLDPHFLDQLDLYRDWQYKPMPLRFYPDSRYLPLLVK